MTIAKILNIAKGNHPVRQEELQKLLYPRLTSFWKRLLSFGMKSRTHFSDTRYTLHPFWFVKVTTYANRLPFPHKVQRHAIYIDAVTGERGLTHRIPETEQKSAANLVVSPKKLQQQDIGPMTDDLIESLILRRYLLKRPEVEVSDPEIIYLPYYYGRVTALDGSLRTFMVNALSGEVKIQ